MKCYIFDLDGTLADDGHRHHHVTGKSDWDAYYAACPDDKPISHLVEIAIALWRQGFSIAIVTGRPETIRPETEAWLIAHGIFWHELLMRKKGDRRHNSAVKLEAVQQLRAKGYVPLMAFEDLPPAARAYRTAGLPCALVAEAKEWSSTHGGSN